MEKTILKTVTQGDADYDINCPASVAVNLNDVAGIAKRLYGVLNIAEARSIRSVYSPVLAEYDEDGNEIETPYDYCVEVTDLASVCVFGRNKHCSSSTLVAYMDFKANEGVCDASKQ